MPKKKIGEEIAKAREEKSLSQRQLAKLVHISNAEMSKIESGEREVPNPKILRRLSKHIDLNYNDMLQMVGLGSEHTPLNPFIENYYKNLKGNELIDTIQDLEYQNETNRLILNILDEVRFKEEKKNAKNKNVF